MKCLPSATLPRAHGRILHDWHAEVLAIRAFNRFLLDQCLLLASPPHASSPFLEHTPNAPHPFALRENVQIHLYCSEAPCGDASMELTMSAQSDPTPWTTTPPRAIATNSPAPLRGRTNFSFLGAVRCKPSRPDAPPTLSKSCTDKLALKQATSLLSSPASLLICPANAYLHTLILPASQIVPAACERAFSRSGRLATLTDASIASWGGGYTFRAFAVAPTTREFRWSRRRVAALETPVPSNLSAAWTPAWQETLIGGVLQGRKQLDPRGASRLCRRRGWALAVRIVGLLSAEGKGGYGVGRAERYGDVKRSGAFAARSRVKADMKMAGLQGWVGTTGDEDWSLDDNEVE